MTQEKEALKLALEFIERVNKDGWILADFEPQMYEVMTAIKEVLAQPEQEPVMRIDWWPNSDTERYIANMVPWERLPIGTLLYTAPPQRKPLTDEQILELNFDGEFCVITDDDEQILDFARAIEAAHGIKE